jgi:hypothetical protein
MRALAIFSIWMIAGFGATGLVTTVMQQVLAPAQQAAHAEAYVPPTLTSMSFVAEGARRS